MPFQRALRDAVGRRSRRKSATCSACTFAGQCSIDEIGRAYNVHRRDCRALASIARERRIYESVRQGNV